MERADMWSALARQNRHVDHLKGASDEWVSLFGPNWLGTPSHSPLWRPHCQGRFWRALNPAVGPVGQSRPPGVCRASWRPGPTRQASTRAVTPQHVKPSCTCERKFLKNRENRRKGGVLLWQKLGEASCEEPRSFPGSSNEDSLQFRWVNSVHEFSPLCSRSF